MADTPSSVVSGDSVTSPGSEAPGVLLGVESSIAFATHDRGFEPCEPAVDWVFSVEYPTGKTEPLLQTLAGVFSFQSVGSSYVALGRCDSSYWITEYDKSTLSERTMLLNDWPSPHPYSDGETLYVPDDLVALLGEFDFEARTMPDSLSLGPEELLSSSPGIAPERGCEGTNGVHRWQVETAGRTTLAWETDLAEYADTDGRFITATRPLSAGFTISGSNFVYIDTGCSEISSWAVFGVVDEGYQLRSASLVDSPPAFVSDPDTYPESVGPQAASFATDGTPILWFGTGSEILFEPITR